MYYFFYFKTNKILAKFFLGISKLSYSSSQPLIKDHLLYQTRFIKAIKLLNTNTVKPVHVVTSMKQSPVLKCHLFLVQL